MTITGKKTPTYLRMVTFQVHVEFGFIFKFGDTEMTMINGTTGM